MNIDVEDFIQQMKQVVHDENLAMEARMEQRLEEKLEQKLEQKLEEKLEQKLDEKFDEKLAPIMQEIEDIKLILDSSFTATQEQIDDHEIRLTKLEAAH